MKKLFSIVIPVYKNELNLPITIPYIMEQIPILFSGCQVELILVNDGSPDCSWEIMKEYQQQYPEVIRIANLTRNFGQAMAIRCGISLAKGDAIGVISADLQDPLELFSDMLEEWENGAELVCGVRQEREEKGLSIWASKMTHLLINRFITNQYPEGGFDFFVISREAAGRYLQIEEKNGSIQLQLLWVSSVTKFIPYARMERKLGKSSWTFSKKTKYFIDTFVSNSYLPLRVMSVGGIIFAGIAFVSSVVIFIMALFAKREVPGWSSLALLITFFVGLILTAMGVMGEYMWRIYDEVKRKPAYLLKEKIEKTNNEEV